MTNLRLGQTVVNFGFVAKVVGFHGDMPGAHRGIPEDNWPILKPRRGGKWLADPDKCLIIDDETAKTLTPADEARYYDAWPTLPPTK